MTELMFHRAHFHQVGWMFACRDRLVPTGKETNKRSFQSPRLWSLTEDGTINQGSTCGWNHWHELWHTETRRWGPHEREGCAKCATWSQQSHIRCFNQNYTTTYASFRHLCRDSSSLTVPDFIYGVELSRLSLLGCNICDVYEYCSFEHDNQVHIRHYRALMKGIWWCHLGSWSYGLGGLEFEVIHRSFLSLSGMWISSSLAHLPNTSAPICFNEDDSLNVTLLRLAQR